MIIKQLPVSERPREKMLAMGTRALSNRELLAVLLGSGSKERSALVIADELLQMDSRGLRSLADCSGKDLARIRGIGQAKASILMAAIELGRRIADESRYDSIRISSTSDVLGVCMERMRYYSKEYFNALLLNAKGLLISEENISVGDLTGSVVHPREAFKSAVNKSAAAVIFIHNHPSGDPSPSEEDILVTKRLCEAGKILGIQVHDHVIIGDGTHVSMREKGYIDY
jgi:DNA repair protein RadC